MKYRKDFVTNSSSSSYICEICGETAHGMDLSIRDAEMCECVNGHIFCNEHSLERPSKEEMIKDILSRLSALITLALHIANKCMFLI